MTWTEPRDWVVNEVVTASIMDTHVRDNLLSVMHAYGSRELTEVSVISTTSEVSLYTTPPVIVGGDLGTTGTFYAMHFGTYRNNAAGDVTIRLKLGATTVRTLTFGGVLAVTPSYMLEVWVEANGSESSQLIVTKNFHSGGGSWTNSIEVDTASIDMTTNQTFNITAQPATSSAEQFIKSRARKQYLGRN